jgi:zinc D-Ala-D-Ala carboxypeptidase
MRFPKKASPTFRRQFGNPLDSFRSYTFHHIWVIARNTDVALDIFRTADTRDQILNSPNTRQFGGVRTPLTLRGRESDPNGKVVVLLNGMTDADLFIDNVRMDGVVQPPEISPGSNTMISQEIMMKVVEPQGVRFLNIYRQALIDLRVANHDAIHVLKTIFVGIRDDGTEEIIDTVPPTMLQFINMEAEFSEQGASYDMMFMHSSAVPFSKALSVAPTGVQIKAGGSIQTALEDIARAFTKAAQANAEKVKGRPLQYRIILDDSIKEVAGWSMTSAVSVRQEGANGANPQSIPANITIESMIDRVFSACDTYITQAGKTDPSSFWFKIIATVYRTATSSEVVYRIVKYNYRKRYDLTDKARDAALVPGVDNPEEDAFDPDDPVLIYDYLFTGRNTDVLRYDMKITEGLGFFTTMTNVNNYSDSYAQGTTNTIAAASPESSNVNEEGDPADRSVAPGHSGNLIMSKNTPLANAKAQYDSLLFQHLSIEAAKLGSVVRLRGNPGYMSCFSVDPRLIANAPGESPEGMLKPSDIYLAGVPFIFMNVQMPATWTGNEDPNSTPVMERFWYRGVWEILQITTEFSGNSDFTQELTLLAVATSGPQIKVEEKPNSSEVNSPQPAEPKVEEAQKVETDPTVRAIKETNNRADNRGQRPGRNNQSLPGPAPAPAPSPPPPPPPAGVSGSLNGKFTRDTIQYDTQVTTNFKYGDILRTSKVNWERGENDPPSDEVFDNLIFTLQQMQRIRDFLGVPIRINSGYRNPTVNRRVGGAEKSDHGQGLAVDFVAPNFGAPNQVVSAISKSGIPFKQLIDERPPNTNGWTHIAFSRQPGGNKGQTLSYFGRGYTPFVDRG